MKLPEQPMMQKAKRLSNSLYRAYKKEQPIDCQDLLLEWVGDCFWGRIVSEHIPVFHKTWNLLVEKGHTKFNKFEYGDIDVGLWYEKIKNKENHAHRKVIVSERYCSTADDNIHIFVMDDYPKTLGYNFSSFKAVTVWNREKKSISGIDWGDDRNIDIPSLTTYRKRDFDYGYNDARDKGHIFKWEGFTIRVENSIWNSMRIPHALQTLRWDLDAIMSIE